MITLAITIITALLTAIFGLLAYIGKKTISSVESLHTTLTEIKVDISQVATSHEDLKERVNKLESKVYE